MLFGLQDAIGGTRLGAIRDADSEQPARRARGKRRPTAAAAGLERPIELLIVDPDAEAATVLAGALCEQLPCVVHFAHTANDARMKIGRYWRRLDLAISDMDMPELMPGEVVETLAQFGVPSLVYCSMHEPTARASLLNLNVIDVVKKSGPRSLEYMVATTARLMRNRSHTALVVEPRLGVRRLMATLLERYQFQVAEAADPKGASEFLKSARATLAVVACSMPRIDGIHFTAALRSRFGKEELAVIGCGARDEFDSLPKMLKAGANDIFTRPFTDEEFFCRVCHNAETIENINAIRKTAITDFLSGLYNRRHLFSAGEKLRTNALKAGRRPVAAMLDIDFFKRVNDTYGHDAGDLVIKSVAHAIRDHIGDRGLVARFGGEEFCVVMDGEAAIAEMFDSLRLRIEALDMVHAGERINVTSSTGISCLPGSDLDEQINDADQALYQAKQSGRNRVMLSDGSGTRCVSAGA